MATFRKRGKKWYAEIRRRGYPPQFGTFDSKTDAKMWADDTEGGMRRGRFRDQRKAERTLLSEALERYGKEVSVNKKGMAQELSRIKVIQRDIIADYSLANLGSDELADYRDRRLKVVKPETINNELILISHLFTVARTEWKMKGLENPMEDVKRPKLSRGRTRRVTPAEEQKLIDNASRDAAAAIIVAIETGMRRGEVAGLRWQDISGNVARLEDTKNGEVREVPLSSRALGAMKSLPRRIDGQVFGLSAGWLSHAFLIAARRAGIDGVRFHDLRHEATSRLFERGLSIEEVSKITGHKTWSMLARYTHLKATDLAQKLG